MSHKEGVTHTGSTQNLTTEKNESSTGEAYTIVQKEDEHFLLQWESVQFVSTNASEAEVITDPKKSRKVNHKIP